jgi:hypothetical protein
MAAANVGQPGTAPSPPNLRHSSPILRHTHVKLDKGVGSVGTIFEATARIIERDGMGSLNTNRIAGRAGIAIGTLFGYFANKA